MCSHRLSPSQTTPVLLDEQKDKVPWTTARCNRLLRPLTSRLVLLRKHLDKVPHAGTAVSVPVVNDWTLNTTRSKATDPLQGTDKKGRGTTLQEDPDWSPFAARKTLKRKYSSHTGRGRLCMSSQQSKPKRRCQSSGQPGEITVFTPFISKFSQDGVNASRQEACVDDAQLNDISRDVVSPTAAVQGLKPRIKGCLELAEPQAHLRDLKKTMMPTFYALLDGIYTGVDKLLKETRASLPSTRPGPGSLFLTCLNRVPQYIAEEQRCRKDEDDDDDSDVSAEVYADLEDLGCRIMQGWRPLRSVVRAHGIHILKSAVQEHLLPPEAVRGLVILCIHNAAFAEAEELLLGLIAATKPLSKPTTVDSRLFDPSTQLCLSLVDRFADLTNRRSFQYRQLARMMEVGQIPVEWMATRDMLPLWNFIVRSISEKDCHYTAATELMQVIVRLGCGLRRQRAASNSHKLAWEATVEPLFEDLRSSQNQIADALSNTVSSLLTLLTTIALVGRDKSNGDYCFLYDSKPVVWPLRSLSVSFSRALTAMSGGPDARGAVATCAGKVTPVLAMMLILNTCIDRSTNSASRDTIQSIIRYNISTFGTASRWVARNVHEFICSTARCCGKASYTNGFEYLKEIVATLVSFESAYAIGAPCDTSRLVRKIALNAALSFAEQSADNKHFAFAKSLEESAMLSGVGHSIPTSQEARCTRRQKAQTGYRWEEGICEWVMATPANTRRKRTSGAITSFLLTPPSTSEEEIETASELGVEENEVAKEKPCATPMPRLHSSNNSDKGAIIGGDHKVHHHQSFVDGIPTKRQSRRILTRSLSDPVQSRDKPTSSEAKQILRPMRQRVSRHLLATARTSQQSKLEDRHIRLGSDEDELSMVEEADSVTHSQRHHRDTLLLCTTRLRPKMTASKHLQQLDRRKSTRARSLLGSLALSLDEDSDDELG